MNFRQYKYLILSDLYRYGGKKGIRLLIKFLFFQGPEGFKYTFWMRTANYSKQNKFLKYFIYPISRLFLSHYMYKFGISIPRNTPISSGFYIGHFGGIVINEKSIIGKNCNISQGVTLGQANRGKNKGTPIIKNNVYIGPGVKIVGKVTIGNNVALGANCVVTKDIPDNAVAVGIPAKVISYHGSKDYINFTNYPTILLDHRL